MFEISSKISLLLLTLTLFFGGCVVMPNTTDTDEIYEFAKKLNVVEITSYTEHSFHDKPFTLVHYTYHPGDFFAHDVSLMEFHNRNDYVIRYAYGLQNFWDECVNQSATNFDCENVSPSLEDTGTCLMNNEKDLSQCIYICYSDKLTNASISKHIQGGYYSDGSYFATYTEHPIIYVFKNIHPTRNKYKKSKWQKDRDECMELTDKNVQRETGLLRNTAWKITKFLNNSLKYYQNCLKKGDIIFNKNILIISKFRVYSLLLC